MFLIAYDISDDKTRAKAAAVIEQYAARLQKSVWLCPQPAWKMRQMLDRLERLDLGGGVLDVWEVGGLSARMGDMPLPELPDCHVA